MAMTAALLNDASNAKLTWQTDTACITFSICALWSFVYAAGSAVGEAWLRQKKHESRIKDDSESKELHNNKAISILFTIKTLWDIISDGFYNIYPSRRTPGVISFNTGKVINEWEKDIQHKANEINKTNSLQISPQATYLKGIQTEQYERCDKYAYVRVRSEDKHAECHLECDNCEKLSKECANLLGRIKYMVVDIEGLKIENKMLKLLLPTMPSRSRSNRPLCSARRY